jgi:hypothetical protein
MWQHPYLGVTINMNDVNKSGQARVRTALAFFACAILLQFVATTFVPGLLNPPPEDMYGFFKFGCLAFFLIFASTSLAIWFWGFRLILLASLLFRFVVARTINVDSWQVSTIQSLWPMPYASAIGAVVYIIYFAFHFGGWPDDVIFGSIGNILGAWCYLSVFWGWFQLTRGQQKSRDSFV